MPGGRAADALGRRRVIIIGCTATAGGMLVLAFLPALAGYLAGLAMCGIGSGLLDVAPAAMIGDILTGRGGTLVASYQMAGDAGSVTGPVAAGYLVDTASYASAFGLGAGVLGPAAVFGLLAPETRTLPQARLDTSGRDQAQVARRTATTGDMAPDTGQGPGAVA